MQLLVHLYKILQSGIGFCLCKTDYRCWLEKFSLSTISAVMQVTIYDPTDAFCTAPQCNIMYVDPVSGNDANVGHQYYLNAQFQRQLHLVLLIFVWQNVFLVAQMQVL
jgi:hypothetical protein